MEHSLEKVCTFEVTKNQVRNDVLTLGNIVMQLSRVDRIPRYFDGTRENDAEHSLMLGAIAVQLATIYYPEIDLSLVAGFSVVHDMTEIIDSDTLTFGVDEELLRRKKDMEAQSCKIMQAFLPPYYSDLMRRYNLQEEQEARIVRVVDKLMPLVVDIVGQGCRVVWEDCHVRNVNQLAAEHDRMLSRLKQEYGDLPELLNLYAELACDFEEKFRSSGYTGER